MTVNGQKLDLSCSVQHSFQGLNVIKFLLHNWKPFLSLFHCLQKCMSSFIYSCPLPLKMYVLVNDVLVHLQFCHCDKQKPCGFHMALELWTSHIFHQVFLTMGDKFILLLRCKYWGIKTVPSFCYWKGRAPIFSVRRKVTFSKSWNFTFKLFSVTILWIRCYGSYVKRRHLRFF